MLPANLFKIPRFLEASNPADLSKKMLKNNLGKQMEFKYFDIQFVKGKWYAWYYEDVEMEVKRGV